MRQEPSAAIDFREIADSVPTLIWVSDQNKDGVWFNRTWLDFTGATIEEEMGSGWLARICPDDMPAIDECVRAFADRRPFQTEFRLRRADGVYRWMIDTGVPRYDDQGRFAGFVGSLVDIDAWKNAEEQRRLLSRGINPSRTTATIATASALAHELNQPLTAVSSYIRGARRLLANGHPIEDALVALEAAETCALRAGEIIRAVRSMVMRNEPQARAHDLRTIVDEAILISDLGEGLAWVDNEVPPGHAVRVDAVKIEQVIINLLRNAIEACDGVPQPRIVLSAQDDGNWIAVSVSDNGGGLPDKIRMQPFEPFQSSKASGLGIGLAICRSIVEAHGGEIRLVSTGPEGTTMRFTVPAVGGAKAAASA